jgi:hypothetical protein
MRCRRPFVHVLALQFTGSAGQWLDGDAQPRSRSCEGRADSALVRQSWQTAFAKVTCRPKRNFAFALRRALTVQSFPQSKSAYDPRNWTRYADSVDKLWSATVCQVDKMTIGAQIDLSATLLRFFVSPSSTVHHLEPERLWVSCATREWRAPERCPSA